LNTINFKFENLINMIIQKYYKQSKYIEYNLLNKLLFNLFNFL